MAQMRELTIRLSEEALQFVRSKVESGEYASEENVLQEGVAALKQESEERHRWEQEVMIPAHDRLMADPSSAVTLAEVRESLQVARAERAKAS